MKGERKRSARPKWVPKTLFPYESRFMDVHGHSIHYVDEGSGQVLLFMHGNPTWSFLYRNIIKDLKNTFRCIAMDYPGFGLSQAAEGYDFLPASHARVVDAFVESLGIARFSLMAQDWGGPIGLWVAGHRASQVERLIIGNTWAWPIEGDKHFERFSGLMGGSVGRFMILQFNAFVNLMIPTNVRRRRLSPDVMRAYRGPFPSKKSRMPTWIFPREIRGSHVFLAEVESGLRKLASRPVLILWGDKDMAFRGQERERFEAIFPNHRTQILAGAGHYIQEAAPEDIATAIKQWWSLGD